MTGRQQESLLHRAASHGESNIAELLLHYGAEPNVRDMNGWTSLHEAVAADAERVAELLLSSGADPNALTHWDIPPLFLASTEAIVDLLCAHGAHGFLCN